MSHCLSLDGTWDLRYGPQDENAPTTPQELARSGWPCLPATVPGNVEIDLEKAGLLPDLEVGENAYATLDYERFDWWYRRDFEAPAPKPGQRLELVFEGIDCLATLWLNGQPLGRAENMFIPHRFDVTDLLKRGAANEICVRIRSAVLEGRRKAVEPGGFALDSNYESLHVRKAGHMYGWDIMPRIVSAGLWRGVRLETLDPDRIDEVYWTTLRVDPAKRWAMASAHWNFRTGHADLRPLRLRFAIRQDGRELAARTFSPLHTGGRTAFELHDVDLWWPRGSGKPALCETLVELLDGDRVLDCQTGTLGVRTVKLERTEVTTPASPGEFVFVVNGQKTFIRGTNWVPLDALHARDPRHYDAVLPMLADLNCNMVRCWGGNVYEDHAFFDFCDRNGILVWQDFALACTVSPQTDDFAEALRAEAEAIVRRLRNHPSLALWVGGNETDDAHGWSGLKRDPNDDRLTRQVLPGVVRRLDPAREYLPNSPYHSPEVYRGGDRAALMPEQHLWGPRDDFKGDFYAKATAHFVSEIGYHGCPDRRSLERFLERGHLWPCKDDPQWLAKCVRPDPRATAYDYRIPLMAKQASFLFGQAFDDLDDFVLASQISQAEALKFFVEWSRLGKWRRTGMLWWNLRDGWPIVSDAVVDYYNRKKLAYEYLKRIQADVCVICGEAVRGRHRLFAVNDTPAPVRGRFALRDADGKKPKAKGAFEIPANGLVDVGAVKAPAKPAMWLIEWELRDGVAGRNHYLAGPRPFKLADYRRWLRALEIPKDVGPER